MIPINSSGSLNLLAKPLYFKKQNVDRIIPRFINYIGELPVYVNPFRLIINISLSYIVSSWGDGAIEHGLMECGRNADWPFGIKRFCLEHFVELICP